MMLVIELVQITDSGAGCAFVSCGNVMARATMNNAAALRDQAMLERHVTLRNGDQVHIRPLVVADAALYPDFLGAVTREDLRLRFFAVMRELPPALIDHLVRYDPATAMAFIAIAEKTGRMLGVVRLHDDASGTSAEFAILMRSHLKGMGLGWLLMQHMIAYARAKGLKTVHGQVLGENRTMLQMCEELGFHSADDPNERGVKYVELPLAEVPAEAVP
jgi:GNAT superfamily N-acetyltransferase